MLEVILTAQGYLNDTEPAVRHLFDGLNAYNSIRLPSILNYVDDTGVVKMSKSENKAFLSAYERYFDLEIARSALAGSILQIAYNCLKRHSPGPLDLNMCSKFGIPHGATSEKLCLGRLVHGIPIGLLIYAGRIQYNHWEDGLPSNPVAKAVFQELVMAYINDTSFDMAYELDFPEPHPVAHFIVRFELKWRNYDDYINDMHSLLKLT